ncbi:beta-N-acetylhexosaminidase [Halobacillus shinanisalinarum]|uniref:beta-N-acetylhexosaminidase n=1 Tax=Halobacillus shinanisalinarum TaxID=2932258 RepID=A0ABY4GYX3_9BACI|nr:beta-N-acetylhexosaminidase [Halobacillus shinanisalinarum]UOQ92870.1 beta-N-acetylhexosaminidase [Halobacillus shinanisalinarum]
MNKRITIIISIAIIALGAAFFFIRSLGDNTNDKQADQQPKNPSSGHENEEVQEPEAALDNIFNLAKQGKIPDSNIVVGETTTDAVQETFGEPDKTTDTDVGRFLNYPSHDIDVGTTDDIVSDMRSSQDQFTSFDFDTIKSYKKSDDTRYYQDEDYNQIILVYELSNNYVLKWVLPNPTGDFDNPDVDHISLSKKIGGDGVNGEKGDDSGDIGDEGMSLDEKIGQMIFSGVDGTEMTAETKNIIQKYHVGGIILFANNIESKTQTVNFLNEMKTANADNPYPLLLGVDEEGGSVTRMPDEIKSLPSSRSIGELNDPGMSFKIGTILGEQMKALGFNLDFAPVLDVNSNPDNPVIGDRSFGANPKIVTRLGIQTMKGIQNEGVISVIKHFPGHGDTSEDSHLELPKVDKSYEELSKLELVPFKKAISESADVSMVAHILLPKIDENYPASMSKKVITGILREDYDFDGVVITDDLTMGAITDHYNVAEAPVQTVKAGGDLLLVAHNPNLISTVFDKLKAAVEDGEISENRIDESVERITHLKAKYQLSDEKTSVPNPQSINEKVEAILQKTS